MFAADIPERSAGAPPVPRSGLTRRALPLQVLAAGVRRQLQAGELQPPAAAAPSLPPDLWTAKPAGRRIALTMTRAAGGGTRFISTVFLCESLKSLLDSKRFWRPNKKPYTLRFNVIFGL